MNFDIVIERVHVLLPWENNIELRQAIRAENPSPDPKENYWRLSVRLRAANPAV